MVSVPVSPSTFLLKHSAIGWPIPQSPALCKEHDLSSTKAAGRGPFPGNNHPSLVVWGAHSHPLCPPGMPACPVLWGHGALDPAYWGCAFYLGLTGSALPRIAAATRSFSLEHVPPMTSSLFLSPHRLPAVWLLFYFPSLSLVVLCGAASPGAVVPSELSQVTYKNPQNRGTQTR